MIYFDVNKNILFNIMNKYSSPNNILFKDQKYFIDLKM
jgi:hypothetical protein